MQQKQWLVVAEADAIQLLIGRSTKLREVVGGSQLVAHVGNEAEKVAKKYNMLCPLCFDGGAIRATFDSETNARAFADQMKVTFHRHTGGTLSAAEPLEFDATVDDPSGTDPLSFQYVLNQAHRALRIAKSRGRVPSAVVQLPYVAFCASCGVGIAADFATAISAERPNYVCHSCQARGREAKSMRAADFEEPILAAIEGATGLSDRTFPREAGDVGAFDRHRYVAYIKADGMNMGQVFGRCPLQNQQQLSREYARAIRQALAVAVADLMQTDSYRTKAERQGGFEDHFPLIPLILAGDDVFLLVPARWSIALADHFCRSYEREVQQVLDGLDLEVDKPAFSAAVVICKESYPHYLAHARAKAVLSHAKSVARQYHVAQQGEPFSAVAFEVVKGSSLEGSAGAGETGADYIGSFQPYVARATTDRIEDGPSAVALSIRALFDCRDRLRASEFPGGRVAQLSELFHQDNIRLLEDRSKHDEWFGKFDAVRRRIDRVSKHRQALHQCLTDLGRGGTPVTRDKWREHLFCEVRREGHGEICWMHGLPDLLTAYDYLEPIGPSPRSATPGTREGASSQEAVK